MSEPHDLPVLGLHFDPSTAEALPQQTFAATHKLQANGETLALQHFAPAHTDTDIYIHFQKANVIQMADLFFNGIYPYIDPGTGGKITGMIAAADKILSLAMTPRLFRGTARSATKRISRNSETCSSLRASAFRN
jgi:hypothetical protein